MQKIIGNKCAISYRFYFIQRSLEFSFDATVNRSNFRAKHDIHCELILGARDKDAFLESIAHRVRSDIERIAYC